MTDINSLFKKPNIPSKTALLSKKRKLEPYSAQEALKNARREIEERGKGKGASVEDGDMMDEDGPAGSPLPGGREFDEDDEEGRFFGGGVTERQAEILDFMDEKEEDTAPEKIDSAWLRKTALNFEKKISLNAEKRGKFEDEPQKFMISEAELDEAIKSLSILSDHSELYEEFASLGCASSLVGLLTHENTDIAGDVVEVISELTDEDVDADAEQWSALVDAMLDADLLDMLISNLQRLDERNEGERSVVYHTLSVLENLASQTRISELISAKTNLFPWILSRLQARESPISQNKQYSSEVLSILLQSSSANRNFFLAQLPNCLNGLDTLLQLLSPYRKRDPQNGGEEEEFFENVFDVVTCLVSEPVGKEKFVDAEGVELALIMLREAKKAKPRALRLLDHSCSGIGGGLACERLVEMQGLKTIFGMFMKKTDAQTTEHLLGIFASLLQFLPAESALRIRTLAKFVEKDYEKITRIITLRGSYVARLHDVEKQIELQKKQTSEEDWEDWEMEWESRRLEGGKFCLQLADLVLSWMCAEDDGARGKIQNELEKKGMGTEVLGETLRVQLKEIGGGGQGNEVDSVREMLLTLIKFV